LVVVEAVEIMSQTPVAVGAAAVYRVSIVAELLSSSPQVVVEVVARESQGLVALVALVAAQVVSLAAQSIQTTELAVVPVHLQRAVMVVRVETTREQPVYH